MDYTSAVFILGIMFWVLCALLIVCCLAWSYIRCMYYKWDRQDRERETVLREVVETVEKTIDSVKN